jgi:shikimate dehydrogenase
MKKRLYGLIGYPLGHSFSARYFAEKFSKEDITDADYQLFPIEQVAEFPLLCSEQPRLRGLNVTIPYKQSILPFVHRYTDAVQAIGATNCIRLEQDGSWTATNTDAIGFELALLQWLPIEQIRKMQALILGNGGSAAAVKYVLKKLGIQFQVASRKVGDGVISYTEANQLLKNDTSLLIVQTTPLGMAPATDALPPIDIRLLSARHFVFDLIYNPAQSLLLQHAQAQGAASSNGLQMLYLQAEYAWKFWNERDC